MPSPDRDHRSDEDDAVYAAKRHAAPCFCYAVAGSAQRASAPRSPAVARKKQLRSTRHANPPRARRLSAFAPRCCYSSNNRNLIGRERSQRAARFAAAVLRCRPSEWPFCRFSPPPPLPPRRRRLFNFRHCFRLFCRPFCRRRFPFSSFMRRLFFIRSAMFYAKVHDDKRQMI